MLSCPKEKDSWIVQNERIHGLLFHSPLQTDIRICQCLQDFVVGVISMEWEGKQWIAHLRGQ